MPRRKPPERRPRVAGQDPHPDPSRSETDTAPEETAQSDSRSDGASTPNGNGTPDRNAEGSGAAAQTPDTAAETQSQPTQSRTTVTDTADDRDRIEPSTAGAGTDPPEAETRESPEAEAPETEAPETEAPETEAEAPESEAPEAETRESPQPETAEPAAPPAAAPPAARAAPTAPAAVRRTDEPAVRPRLGGSRPAAGVGTAAGAGRRPVATLIALIAVFVITAGLAVWFYNTAAGVRSSGSAQNQALVDVGATAQVNNQISDALETVYSYDFTQLDAKERAASQVVTGEFAGDYQELFVQVRELAPPQQAVVSAVVVASAVKVLHDDRASLVVFINQQGTKGATGQQIAAHGRLTVSAQQVDGRWKIADVQNW